MNFHQGQRLPDKMQRGLVQNGFYAGDYTLPGGAARDALMAKRIL